MQIAWKHIIIGMLIAVILAVLFTFLAIYDSDKMPFEVRFAFWLSTIGVAFAALMFLAPIIMTGRLARFSIATRLCVLAALISLPVPIVLFGFDTGFDRSWPVSNWLLQYCLVLVLALLIVGFGYVTIRAMGFLNAAVEKNNDDDIIFARRFLGRLSAKFQGADLYAISSEDHYLRVHTNRGEELILMRISDALVELEAMDGLQTHRSWWVAHNGVASLTRDNGKFSVILKSGIAAPVARSRVKSVRAAFG